jgi:hypothetical protein
MNERRVWAPDARWVTILFRDGKLIKEWRVTLVK